ncbi:MAG TPA: hypothetical protein VGI65_03325 [Steroidobacteraceae bacterium]|jgi:hypothetical protein
MSKRMRAFGVCIAALAGLAACGGNGAGSGGATNSSGTGTAYPFIAPIVNSSRVYSETIIDNSNNTINIGYMVAVVSVAADGTITEQQQSTSGIGDTVNGTDYSALTETQTFNSFGRETAYAYTESNNSVGSCAYSPYEGGPTPPLTVGQRWQINYTQVCNGNAPISYSQQGNIADVEAVTVPAGTFTALKLQSTVTWTDASGTTHTQTVANWLDIATFHSVKQSSTFVDSGTPPANGYAVSRQTVLESTS